MKSPGRVTFGRRRFLHAIGASTAAAASAPLATAALADTETNEQKRKARYQESAHVKAYYRVNRYPGSK